MFRELFAASVCLSLNSLEVWSFLWVQVEALRHNATPRTPALSGGRKSLPFLEHIREHFSRVHSLVRLLTVREHFVDHDSKTPHVRFAGEYLLSVGFGSRPLNREPYS